MDNSQFVEENKLENKGLTYKVVGTTLQALSVQLDQGEEIFSEAGKMSWMTDNIKLNTHSGGCSQMFSRLFTQESIFLNKFTCLNGTGVVTFTSDQAGKIIPLELNENTPDVIFQKGAYLCSEKGIERKISIVKKNWCRFFWWKRFYFTKSLWERKSSFSC